MSGLERSTAPAARAVTLACAILTSAYVSLVAATPARAASSPWVPAPESQVRLIAGGGGQEPLVAGVEIRLSPGWKTYWRSPGDAGGVPPYFDWSGSENVASPQVLFPAPKRYTDKAGDSIGYKEHVVLPVRITPGAAGAPVAMRLKLEFGICREICIPAEAQLSLDLPAGGAGPAPSELAAALARVPGDAKLPALRKSEARLSGDKPQIILEAEYPTGETHADVFVEGPDGVYVPMARAAGQTGNVHRFEIDIANGADPADIKGKTLTVTLTGDSGQAEARFKAE